MQGESPEANGTDAPQPCDSAAPTQIRTEITRVRSPTFTDRQLPDLFEAQADRRLHHGVERAGESHRHLWLDWMQEEQQFFADEGARARADLLVDGNPTTPHDEETKVVVLD